LGAPVYQRPPNLSNNLRMPGFWGVCGSGMADCHPINRFGDICTIRMIG
jgi:hypothetical protein